MTTLLSLTAAQQSETAKIFASASSSHAEVKKSVKGARQTLGEAVKNNDHDGINRVSNALGTLAAQHHSLGASAQAAFFQILTPDQQTKLNQFRS
jgi:Spy/CpxP family protein refolding chaperone